MSSDLLLGFAIIAVVLTVAPLLSGLVERSPLSFPLLFLGLGFVLGDRGFGVIELGPHSPILEVVATLTLALVLFLDATRLQVNELGRRWVIPVLILGPGTGLIIALGAVPLGPPTRVWLGDGIHRRSDSRLHRPGRAEGDTPRPQDSALGATGPQNRGRHERPSGAAGNPGADSGSAIRGSTALDWGNLPEQASAAWPVIGFAIGGAGAWFMSRVDARMTIRMEHQALFGIGLVLAAYAAATVAGGDGFLGAFAAGLAVVLLNQTLCDCFLDYGEITSEMAMLLAFVLFGAVISGIIGTISIGPALILAALVILVFRPSALGIVLSRAKMSWEARVFVSWFGPRGLNSLLLALLVVQAGIVGSELLLATVGVVVMVSVVVHGATATPFSAWYGRKASEETLVEEREGTAAGLFSDDESEEVQRISPEELSRLLEGPNPPIILDVRSRSSYERDNARSPGDVRVLPDQVTEWAATHPSDKSIVAYCT